MKIALVDERIPAAAETALQARGFYVIKLPPCPTLGAPLASHTDMLVARLGRHLITTADYCDRAAYAFTDLLSLAPWLSIHFSSDTHGAKYPADAILNVLPMGRLLFCKENSVSPYLLALSREEGYRTVSVKQGYPACTVLRLNDGAAITADRGMAEAMRAEGIRVYEIEDGGIDLAPYPFGFIGGCAGVLDDTVYFIGDLDLHPSAGRIRDALAREGMNAISLGDGRLVDLGGILLFNHFDNHGSQGNQQ